MEKKQVFISYKSEEFDEALWVKTALEQQGISCWMAPMCITGGGSYAAEIPAAINDCSVFVLILSEKVQQSKWVPRELDQAINAGKLIMPFMLEDCVLKDEFKFYLSNIQRYFAYQDKMGTMEIMSREIRRVLGIPDPVIPEPPAEEPEKPPVPVQKEPVKKTPAKKTLREKEKKRRRIWPFILAGAAVTMLLPVLLFLLILSGSKTTFAGTEINKNAYTLRVENQTVTASDLELLDEFSNLEHICLTDCTVVAEDLSAFSKLSLWGLELEGCDLTDQQLQTVDFAAMELSCLNLSRNPLLTDLEMIAPLSERLTQLSIGDTGIRDLAVLKSFHKLEELSIENLGLNSLEPLQLAVYLETLVADGNRLVDLAGLQNTTILQYVSLKNNQLKNVDCLAFSAATLEELYLDDNFLEDLSCLSSCTNITAFSADRNLLTTLDWLSTWTDLQRLSAANNLLKETVKKPSKSKSIRFLDLSGNQLTGFQGFVFEENQYVTIDLSNNDLTSVTLPTNRKYQLLALHGNPITDLDFAKTITCLNMSIDYFEEIKPTDIQNFSLSNLYIVECPPNRIVELEQVSCVTLVSREEIGTVIPAAEFPEY